MADGVLGISGGGAAALNNETITKLKASEKKALISPIEKKISDIDSESKKMAEIKSLNIELKKSFATFSLNNNTNAFLQKTATTTGDAVLYDTDDLNTLIDGTRNVEITQLAHKDTYQSNTFSDKLNLISNGQDANDMLTIKIDNYPQYQSDKISTTTNTDLVGKGVIKITSPHNGAQAEFTTTSTTTWNQLQSMINSNDNFNASFVNGHLMINNKYENKELEIKDKSGTVAFDLGLSQGRKFSTINNTYEQLSKTINQSDNLVSSVEKISDTDFRLIIKSKDEGILGKLTILEDGINLGFSDNINHKIRAQNMNAIIDGISYNVSSNTLTMQDGLKLTANELGDSSISITRDNSIIAKGLKNIIENYNDMVKFIDSEIADPQSPIKDKSSLAQIKNGLRELLFANYNNIDGKQNQNLFSVGFEFNKNGQLSLNETILNKAISEDLDNLKALFVGTHTSNGLFTLLEEYTDNLDSPFIGNSLSGGILGRYDHDLTRRETQLQEILSKENKILDNKYKQLASQYASYGSLINNMESNFSGLKMMIDQSSNK